VTNHLKLSAVTVAAVCRERWQIELFFNWIKQHLRIKAIYGYGENAVKTQIWIAGSIYVLVSILKKRLTLEASLHEILQLLSLTLFEQVPVLKAFERIGSQEKSGAISNQLNLWDI
jgi:IS4 transposase